MPSRIVDESHMLPSGFIKYILMLKVPKKNFFFIWIVEANTDGKIQKGHPSMHFNHLNCSLSEIGDFVNNECGM